MKIAIVGSRSVSDYDLFSTKVREALSGLQVDEIVSGGALGVDTFARRFAAENGITFREIKADWRTYGKRGGFIRNGEIVRLVDFVVACWDGVSHGTRDTIERTKAAGKPLRIIGFIG